MVWAVGRIVRLRPADFRSTCHRLSPTGSLHLNAAWYRERAGSGKTYTMMGPAGAAPSSSGEGIIPRMCRDILARLQAITDSKKAIGTVEAT